MKIRNKVTGLSTVIAIILIVISPWIVWHFKPDRKLNVLIFDKTVPQNNYREHKGFTWLLNSYKYVKPDGNKYSLLDYYGFFPEKDFKYKIKPLPENLVPYDLIYLTDTYGVYDRDFYGDTKNIEGERSKKIYGGTQFKEVELIAESIKKSDKHKTLIAEFNSLASPTEEKVKNSLDDLLDIKWTGWIGREFKTLNKNNDEIPKWVFRNYRKQYGQDWKFKSAGYIFVKNDDTLFVLEKGKDTKKDMVFRFTQDGEEMFEKKEIGYYYWFDIVSKGKNSIALADYEFSLTQSGLEKFNKFGIPVSFPAIIQNKKEKYTSYYFSGDYADKSDFPVLYQAVGLSKINSLLISNYGNTDAFFWKVYAPVIQKILDNTYDSVESYKTVQKNN